ncbi:ABC transporter permease subunit [Rhizobium beringeri]
MGPIGTLLLPTMTLGLWGGATIARVTRAAMIEVLKEPYIDAARARGLHPCSIELSEKRCRMPLFLSSRFWA